MRPGHAQYPSTLLMYTVSRHPVVEPQFLLCNQTQTGHQARRSLHLYTAVARSQSHACGMLPVGLRLRSLPVTPSGPHALHSPSVLSRLQSQEFFDQSQSIIPPGYQLRRLLGRGRDGLHLAAAHDGHRLRGAPTAGANVLDGLDNTLALDDAPCQANSRGSSVGRCDGADGKALRSRSCACGRELVGVSLWT